MVDRVLASRLRPAAISTSNPETSLGVLCVLLRAQVQVPEEMAMVAGWDDEFLAHTDQQTTPWFFRLEPAPFGSDFAERTPGPGAQAAG